MARHETQLLSQNVPGEAPSHRTMYQTLTRQAGGQQKCFKDNLKSALNLLCITTYTGRNCQKTGRPGGARLQMQPRKSVLRKVRGNGPSGN